MSLFNNLKNILGFPETENENTADMQESVERTPYINPFKDETHHVPAPSEEPANQRPSLSTADIDEKMRMKIIEKLIKKGLIAGVDDDGNLGISYDLLRILVINDRAGLYDN